MKIAFFTNFIPPYRKTFYEKLCADAECHWHVVRGAVTGETGRPDYKGPLAAPNTLVQNVEKCIGPYTLRYQKGAVAAVRTLDPDVVVLLGMVGNLSNWLLLLWAKAKKRRVLIWACGWEAQRPGSMALRLKQVLTRVYFGAADRCLLYSTKGAAYLAACGVPANKLTVCFNGIEIEDLRRQESQVFQQAREIRALTVAGDNFVYLYVGSMLDGKGVDILLRAYRQIEHEADSTHLWLIGDGPALDGLKQQAAQLGLHRVIFFGRIIDGVDSYFAAADAFVLPGLGGLALNQAMFWRKPCICGEADGTEEDLVLEEQTGFRFKAGDQASLFDAMSRARRTPQEMLEMMGERARRIIEQQSNVDAMVEVFRREVRLVCVRG